MLFKVRRSPYEKGGGKGCPLPPLALACLLPLGVIVHPFPDGSGCHGLHDVLDDQVTDLPGAVPHLPGIGIEEITRAEREAEEVKFIDGSIKMIQGVILWREERPWCSIHFGVCQPVIVDIMRRTWDYW